MKKIIIIVISLIVASVIPIIPRDMEFLFAYGFNYESHLMDKYPFEDSDNDGKGYAAVFRGSDGERVTIEITEQRYIEMGEGGSDYYPTKTEFISILESFLPSPASAAIVSGDVVGWWDLETGSGSTATDETGSNDGTISGAAWTTGGPTNLDNGLDFVASENDYVDFGFNPNVSEGTAMIWADIDILSAFSIVFGHGNGGGNGQFDIFTESSDLKGRTRYTGDATVAYTASTDTLYLITYTWSSNSGTGVELFTDTTSRATDTDTGAIDTGSGNLHLGSNANHTTAWFDGQIYQAILFNKILTSDEISDIYNSGDGITYDDFFAPPVANVYQDIIWFE